MSRKLVFVALLSAVVYALPAGARTPASLPTDAAFLAMAAQADMTMAHLGKMAQDRGATDKVKDFAKTLVQDHTSDYQQLAHLAVQAGDKIPRAIDEKNGRTIAAISRYQGKTFERAFLNRQSAEHEKLINAFRQEAEHGSNPAIKTYANKALPTIERHLHDAQDLLKRHA